MSMDAPEHKSAVRVLGVEQSYGSRMRMSFCREGQRFSVCWYSAHLARIVPMKIVVTELRRRVCRWTNLCRRCLRSE